MLPLFLCVFLLPFICVHILISLYLFVYFAYPLFICVLFDFFFLLCARFFVYLLCILHLYVYCKCTLCMCNWALILPFILYRCISLFIFLFFLFFLNSIFGGVFNFFIPFISFFWHYYIHSLDIWEMITKL